MFKISYTYFMLTLIALSFCVIASVQVGLITPAHAISNNVVVSNVIRALRGDINKLSEKMSIEHRELASGVHNEHMEIADLFKTLIAGNRTQHEQLFAKCK